MKKLIVTGLFTAIGTFLLAQTKIDDIITAKEAERIEKVLAADNMRGRKINTPEIDKAADFIESEFKAIGLDVFDTKGTYRQEFIMSQPKLNNVSVVLDGNNVDPKKIAVIGTEREAHFTETTDNIGTYYIKAGADYRKEINALLDANKKGLVLVDTNFSSRFNVLSRLNRQRLTNYSMLVFILANVTPAKYKVDVQQEVRDMKLANVAGVLWGKSKKNEFVIFSGHYDHIGTGKSENGDSIYNGANDDAAGTAAVIMLAKYFKALNNNERTLVFVAFTAEETGGYGSQFFSQSFGNTEVVKAMFNIEMIGTESKWGKNSAYITGYEKTNMGEILAKDLKGTAFTFYPDPYPEQQLFYRSDNATLARLGVPAHTISTSKMDVEPHYHKLTDHIETLDMENMAQVIKAIALSSKSIIAGKETPARVKVEELR
jgi:acetylornithine deacetylase/succinyl-diaminopimelate desuccinylase-like protein